MENISLLVFGFLIGMQHALEADHLAAVASLSAGRSSRRALILRGSVWGLGHTLTLLCICSLLLFLGEAISPRMEATLELAVGVMILLLAGNLLHTVWKRRPHVHVHTHKNGVSHLHVHTHGTEGLTHEESEHAHRHERLGLRRALVVGMMHGAAGSAAMLVLAAAAESLPQALAYVASFGIGSILGMATLSFVASYPMRIIERSANWVNTTAYLSIAACAIFIGGRLISTSWDIL